MLKINDIPNIKVNVGFIGLGYAGFPMACLFSRKYKVTGYDMSDTRISELQSSYDRCGDVDSPEIQEMIRNGGTFTSRLEDLRSCNFYVIVVPTPVDDNFKPDTSYIKAASREVGRVLDKGDIVVFESTVYPGATEEICVPEIESASGLKYNQDFYMGYSPERINPGDTLHTPENVIKITSGSTPEVAAVIDKIYSSVLGEGHTWQASDIRVAEAAKIIENTQRDVNIAFMNEVTQILNSLGINTNEVLDAMNTKWNALGFRPGLVGGHCISVDPYYLIEQADRIGISARMTALARDINNSMSGYVAQQIIDLLRTRLKIKVSVAKILLMGFTFKENCPDIRNTRIIDIYRILRGYTPDVTIYDPWADAELADEQYDVKIVTRKEDLSEQAYDIMAVCVAHEEFLSFDFAGHGADHSLIYDVKGLLRGKNPDGLKTPDGTSTIDIITM